MAVPIRASCQLLLASKLLQNWPCLASTASIASKESSDHLHHAPLCASTAVVRRRVEEFGSERNFCGHHGAAQKCFDAEHERIGGAHQRFGAALASAALLAFWGAKNPVANCDADVSSSDRTRDSSALDRRSDHYEAQSSGDDSSNAARPFHQKGTLPPDVSHSGQSVNDIGAARDFSVDWPRFSAMQVDRDGFFQRQQDVSPSELPPSIANPISTNPATRTTSDRDSSSQTEQQFAAVNMNIASGGSPDLSLSASSSSKSDPPWADEVSHARQGLAKRLANLEPGNTKGVPWPIISKKGQQVAVRFKLAPSADFSHFMVDAVTRLGEDPHAGAPSSGPLVRVQAYDSPVARHILILPSLQSPPASNESQTSPDTNQLAAATPPSPLNTSVSDQSNQPSAASNSVSIVIFQSLVGDPTTEVEYMRRGRFTERELDAIANGVKIGIGKPEGKRDEKPLRSSEPNEQVAREKRKTRGRVAAALSKLESMGVIVYGAETLSEEDGEEKPANSEGATWGHLAGYEEQKQEIEDTILLALQRPEVYDRIARGTRREYESNRPRAILFDGPPGTGKTSTARVIAGRAGVPLLYVPLEAVASKYYGESERLLAAVFNAGKDFPHGCLVFLDEIDALATERDSGMHEATRRVLSVLLRQLDGFEPDRRTIVIAATNRKEDLDAALLSRFDTALTFGLPDFRTRQEIFAQYAQHLSASDREAVAAATESMSGRDIRDICEQAERHWASKVIRAQVPQELPTLEEYLRCCKARRQTVAKAEPPKSRPQNRSELAQQFA